MDIKKVFTLFSLFVFSFFIGEQLNANGFRASTLIGLDGCSNVVCENQGMSVGFGGQFQYRVNNISPGLQAQYLMLPNKSSDSATGMVFGILFDFLVSEDLFGFAKETEFNLGLSFGYGFFSNFNSVGLASKKDQSGATKYTYNLEEFSGPAITPQFSIDYFLTNEIAIGLSGKYNIFWVNEACSQSFAKDQNFKQKCVTRKGKGFNNQFSKKYSPSNFPNFFTIGLNVAYQMGRE